jgi:hypothetical protein
MTVNPLSIAEPFTRGEIQRELQAVREWSGTFWSSFSIDEFFAPAGDAWSPADNVRHLIKSNRPVARALITPRLLLLLRFGPALRASRSYSVLKTTYLEALGSGLRAGRFAPSPLAPQRQTAGERSTAIGRLDSTLADLVEAMGRWPEWWLDHLRLPHPGLGLLTVREMLLFTLYHNTHHVLNVARRKQMLPA